MGTKNNPGVHDCMSKAEPDEPTFTLLGRDPTASLVVTFWRALKMTMVTRGTSKSSKEKLEEARSCAVALEIWAKKLGKDPKLALDAMRVVLSHGPGHLAGDTKEQALWHLRQAASVLKPNDIEELVETQRKTGRPESESDLVASMLYAAGESFSQVPSKG